MALIKGIFSHDFKQMSAAEGRIADTRVVGMPIMPKCQHTCGEARHKFRAQGKIKKVNFIYIAENHNHIASVGCILCRANNILCPLALDLSEEKLAILRKKLPGHRHAVDVACTEQNNDIMDRISDTNYTVYVKCVDLGGRMCRLSIAKWSPSHMTSSPQW